MKEIPKNWLARIAAITGLALLSSLANIPTYAQTCVPNPAGIISWWRAENNGLDAMGRNPATGVGCNDFDPGVVGNSFAFYGAGQHVRIPDSPSLNPTNALTLEAWVYLSAYSDNESVVVAGKDDPYARRQYMLGLGKVLGKWVFRPHIGVRDGYMTVNGATEIKTQTWYHAAMTYDGATLKLYVNGRLDGSMPVRGTIVPSPNPLLIGGAAAGPWYMMGRVDELSLYSRALSADDIASVYLAGSRGKCPGKLPSITQNPLSRTVFRGESVTFSVTAQGTPPLSYQWLYYGTVLRSWTGSSLQITNAQSSDVGYYTVRVSNAVGTVTSEPAYLKVEAESTTCQMPPSGLVSWWSAEGNAQDRLNGNNGEILGSTKFGPGKVGQAFSLDGVSSGVVIPMSRSLGLDVQSLTIETWINPSSTASPQPIVEYGAAGALSSIQLWHSLTPVSSGRSGDAYGIIRGTNGSAIQVRTPAGMILPNQWTHVALTFDAQAKTARLYVNGSLAAVQTSETNVVPNTRQPLNIGFRPGGSAEALAGARFQGKIDEVSIYARALPVAELRSIFLAGSRGKCPPTRGPVIISRPYSQTIEAGQDVTLIVEATGATPLFYQWSADGINLSGANRSSLPLNNLQPGNSGEYSVTVGNYYGIATGTVATLTVVLPSTNCAPAPTGIVGWWKGEGNLEDATGGQPAGGTVSYIPGKVGQALFFDGESSSVVVPASSNLAVQSLTIEGWINPLDISVNPRPIVEYAGDSGHAAVQLFCNLAPGPVGVPGAVYALIRGTNGSALEANSPGGLLVSNQWSHVALTFDSAEGMLKVYVDGNVVASGTTTNLVRPNTLLPVNLGYRPTGSAELLAGSRFLGRLDEISIFNRALNGFEIQSIFASGSHGKCSTPTAPQIVAQPQSQTVNAGQVAQFSVQASGASPLLYQWRHGGANISGATLSSLVLSNVQPTMAGTYSVMVSNRFGVEFSADATLVVLGMSTNCTAAPDGVAGWWRAEGNTKDEISGNSGTGIASYVPGRVGQAFGLNGVDSGLVTPASSTLAVPSLTIEAWINPADSSVNPHPIVEYAGPNGHASVHLWHNLMPGVGVPGALYALVPGTNGTWVEVSTAGGIIPTNQWTHVALTFDHVARMARLFVNGNLVASNTADQEIQLNTFLPVNIGYRPIGSDELLAGERFVGQIDEVTIYNRALIPDEIGSVYRSGASGKCPISMPPVITSHPAPRTVNEGGTAVFTVQATGTAPLLYQWRVGGAKISGATQSSLVLSNVQPFNAGFYSVVVSNRAAATISSNALLTVLTPTNACIPAAPGLVGWWPGNGSTAELVSGNSAVGVNTPAYGTGIVGQAFNIGSTAGLVAPASSNLAVQSLTIEAWIKPSAASAAPIVEYGGMNTLASVQLWYSLSPGALYGLVRNAEGGGLQIFTPANSIALNAWSHVALTFNYSTRTADIFVNGVKVASETSEVEIRPDTFLPVNIGYRQRYSAELLAGSLFRGLIDEVGIYSRALAATEIESIYRSASGGRCALAIAPKIVGQPENATNQPGTLAVFAVQATGTQPLAYQWRRNGTNLFQATQSLLIISNVQPIHAGVYSAVVSNVAGIAQSAAALLTVLAPANHCVPPPVGLVGWWPGNGSTAELVSGNSALGVNTPAYGTGLVHQAFDLIRTAGLAAPASSNLAVQSMTIEAWINPETTMQGPIVEYGGSNTLSAVQLWYSLTPGAVYGLVRNEQGGGLEITTPPDLVVPNAWTHVALTFNYATRTASIFINGIKVASSTSETVIQPNTRLPVTIGYRHPWSLEVMGGWSFQGLIDEVSIYSRPLGEDEILSIFSAGSSGKCRPPVGSRAVWPLMNPVDGFTVGFKGIPGQTLQIERALTVVGPWTPAGSVSIGDDGTAIFADTNAPNGKAFYRAAQ